jgi:hypothetical protein
MLFGLDTGASSNLRSERAGRQVSKINSEDRLRIHGVKGAAAALNRAEEPISGSGNGSSGSNKCSTNCAQSLPRSLKRTKTTRQRLYLIPTQARVGSFRNRRSAVQVRSSLRLTLFVALFTPYSILHRNHFLNCHLLSGRPKEHNVNRVIFPRSSGILLRVASLPGGHGIGDLGNSAHEFVEFWPSRDRKSGKYCP